MAAHANHTRNPEIEVEEEVHQRADFRPIAAYPPQYGQGLYRAG